MNPFLQLKARFRCGEITKPEFIRRAFEHHRALFDYVEIVSTTDVGEIRITPRGVSFAIGADGVLLDCPPGEARVAPLETMNFDSYEPEEAAVMDRLVTGASHILDVGANIGWYAVRFALRAPQTRVYAFEPLPTSFSYLQRNVAANGVGDRVTTFNYGLSDASGPVQFFVSPANGTNASLKNVATAEDAAAVICLTLTLDQWVDSYCVAPDFIKCDVEGSEFLVFKGGERTLRTHRPVVFAELLRKWSAPFGYHPNDVIDWFATLGYRCIAVGAGGARPIARVDQDTVETNYAFLHKDAHAAHLEALGSSR